MIKQAIPSISGSTERGTVAGHRLATVPTKPTPRTPGALAPGGNRVFMPENARFFGLTARGAADQEEPVSATVAHASITHRSVEGLKQLRYALAGCEDACTCDSQSRHAGDVRARAQSSSGPLAGHLFA